MYIPEKLWKINLEVLSRRSFLTFGSLKNLKKSFQIYFYSNHYFLSDELFCKNHFYIWIDQWAQFFHEIYSPANREYFMIHSLHPTRNARTSPTRRFVASSRHGVKIRKNPDGTGTIRIWLYRNLRLNWTMERWSWKEIGTLLKRIISTKINTDLFYDS